MLTPISIDNFFSARQPGNLNSSEDGFNMVYTLNRPYTEFQKEKENELHIQNISQQIDIVLKEKGVVYGSALFLKNVKELAFTYSMSSKNYLCILNTDSSERLDILCPGQVIDMCRDGENLILLIDPNNLIPNGENGNDGYFFEEELKKNEIYIFSRESGMKQIKNLPQIWEINSSNGVTVAVASDGINEGAWYKGYILLIENGGAHRKIYAPERGQVAKPKLSKDGGKFTVLESLWSDRGVVSGDIILVETRSGQAKNLTENMEVSFSHIEWKENNEFIALGQDRSHFSFMVFNSNAFKDILRIKGSISPGMAPSFSMDAHNNAFYIFSNSQLPDEIFKLNIESGKNIQITSVNSALNNLKRTEWKELSWMSDDGLEIHGFLRNPGKNMPTLVMAHGGPTGSVKESFIDRLSFLQEEGYSIFMPNFRGSTGRGRKFAEMNYGDMGGMDLQDILSGVRMLIDQGYADPSKIAITGGSYGGFMTKWAITQSTLFRAAIPLFGIADWVSFHGTTNIAEWDEIQYGESPYKFDKFIKFSPLRYIQNVNCDTLIMHGINDPCVPVSQAFQFYRAMKESGKSVKLLLFPREGHGFMEKEHIIRYMKELQLFLKATLQQN